MSLFKSSELFYRLLKCTFNYLRLPEILKLNDSKSRKQKLLFEKRRYFISTYVEIILSLVYNNCFQATI